MRKKGRPSFIRSRKSTPRICRPFLCIIRIPWLLTIRRRESSGIFPRFLRERISMQWARMMIFLRKYETVLAYILAALAMIYLSYSLPGFLPGDFVTAMDSRSHVPPTADQEAPVG